MARAFERDSAALLQRCAEILTPLTLPAARQARQAASVPGPAARPDAWATISRAAQTPGEQGQGSEAAPARQAPADPVLPAAAPDWAGPEQVRLSGLLQPGAGWTPQTLSREFERDARRYG